jgi:hypothetical protein
MYLRCGLGEVLSPQIAKKIGSAANLIWEPITLCVISWHFRKVILLQEVIEINKEKM